MHSLVNIYNNVVLQSSNLLRDQNLIPATKKKIYLCNMLGVQIITTTAVILQHIKEAN